MPRSEDDDFNSGEDDEEEEEPVPRRGKKRSKITSFLDVEAQEDSDAEDSDEEGESGLPGFIADDNTFPAADEGSGPRARSMFPDDREIEEENLEERLRNRYEGMDSDEEAEAPVGEIGHLENMPSVRDPKLWMVSCKQGHEKEAVVSLMQKFFELYGTADALQIKSAIAVENLKGWVYIEAEKETHVLSSIRGMRILYGWKSRLVPINEMVDVLTVRKKEVEVSKGSWVRVKSGQYKGDLGLVYEVDESKKSCIVKLVPRLDLSKLTGKQDLEDDSGPRKKRRRRPPARPFVSEDISSNGGFVESKKFKDEMFFMWDGQRFKDGYIFKAIQYKGLEVKDVVPTLDELTKYKHSKRDVDDPDAPVKDLDHHKIKKAVAFQKGDVIKVIEGDLIGLMGNVELVQDEEHVIIMPNHPDLHEPLTLHPTQLQKHFKTGDHVKVIAGKYSGETGMIVSIEGNIVMLLSDISNEEIKVFSHDVQEAKEVSAATSEYLGNYGLRDFVLLDGHVVGVIVKVDRDGFRILDQNGNVQQTKLQQIRRGQNSRNAVALDKFQNNVTVGDVVKVLDGPYKDRQASVLHLFRSIAFLYARDVSENGGLFVSRARSVQLLGGNKDGKSGGGPGAALLTQQSTPRNFAPTSTPSLRSPSLSVGRGTPQSNQAYRGGKGGHRKDEIIGKTVQIRGGVYKGYIGVVKDASDTHVRLELHSKPRPVSVERNKVVPIGQQGGAGGGRDGEQMLGRNSNNSWDATRTPMHESMATPMHDSMRTPMHDGMRTPMHDGMRTPMHDGMRTPMHGDDWNPLSPTTPSRNDTWNDSAVNTWTPGPSETNTPNGFQSNTPNPFSPSPFDAQSPAQHTFNAGTPSANYNPPSASSYDVGSSYGNPATPSTFSDRGTPQEGYGTPYSSTPLTPVYSPAISGTNPGTPNDYDASSPITGGAMDEMETEGKWCTTDVRVRISTGQGAPYDDMIGVIREVNDYDTNCMVELEKSKDRVSVPKASLHLEPPKKKDRVKVLGGEHREEIGLLIGIDGLDGIVKMDENSDIKILDLGRLGCYVE